MTEEVGRYGTEGEMRQLISFSVGNEEYGLDIRRVKEVIRISAVTRLPRAPKSVKGIINLRGDVIPIIDLRERFGLQVAAHTESTRVIVVDMQGRSIGMVVDRASQVVRLSAKQTEPTPPIFGGLPAQFIDGVGKIGERLIILLNIDRILSGEEMDDLDQVGPTARVERRVSAPAM